MKIISVITAVSLLAGFGAATTVFAMASQNSDTVIEEPVYDPETNEIIPHAEPNYPVNENGETYGVPVDSPYISDLPDLTPALGINGVVGYVRYTELFGESPSCPEEAVRMQEEREKAGNPPRYINVYESDGVTVIDTFKIG